MNRNTPTIVRSETTLCCPNCGKTALTATGVTEADVFFRCKGYMYAPHRYNECGFVFAVPVKTLREYVRRPR